MQRMVAFLLTVALAYPLLAVAESTEPSSDQIELLLKMQAAARDLDYAGIYTYQQGVIMMSSRVVHLVDGTGERERIEILDGSPREVIRHNDTIQTLLPERKVVLIEQRSGDRFPSLLLGDGHSIADHYDMVIMNPTERVAGRDCTSVVLKPRDEHRYGHVLCIDTETNLLLKAQTVSSANEIIDQVAFSTLTMGEEVAQARISATWDTADWQSIETPMNAVDLSKLGWRIPSPPGFGIVAEVSRPLRRDAYVNQLVLSDGLAAISVFVEPYDPDRHSMSGQGGIHKGALSVFRKRIGDYWLTALGQVPAGTLRDIAEHIEYVPLPR